MKIGILSDTHNHADNTRAALDTLREHGVAHLVHCGDITTPDMILLFGGWRVTFVLGNMDSGWVELGEAALAIGATRPRLSHELEIEGQVIGVTHGADRGLLLRMTMSGRYAYLCRGHTHLRQDEYNSAYGVRLINPGALGGSKPQTRSVAVLDLPGGNLTFIEFPQM